MAYGKMKPGNNKMNNLKTDKNMTKKEKFMAILEAAKAKAAAAKAKKKSKPKKKS